jgi:hypothetical protein
MLAEYFQSPIRIDEIRGCPAGRMLEGFARELHQAGYAQVTARRHLRAAEHLVHWTGGRDIPVLALEERFIKEFSSIWTFVSVQGTVVRIGWSWRTVSVCLLGICDEPAY